MTAWWIAAVAALLATPALAQSSDARIDQIGEALSASVAQSGGASARVTQRGAGQTASLSQDGDASATLDMRGSGNDVALLQRSVARADLRVAGVGNVARLAQTGGGPEANIIALTQVGTANYAALSRPVRATRSTSSRETTTTARRSARPVTASRSAWCRGAEPWRPSCRPADDRRGPPRRRCGRGHRRYPATDRAAGHARRRRAHRPGGDRFERYGHGAASARCPCGAPARRGRPVEKPTRASPPDDLARTYAAVVAQDRTLDTERLVRAVGPETLAQLVTEIGRPGDLGPGDLKPGDLKPGDLKSCDLKGAIPKGVVVSGPTKP